MSWSRLVTTLCQAPCSIQNPVNMATPGVPVRAPIRKGANYHRLADLMDKGKDLAIFRRFDDLNIMCLLSMQAKLRSLEKQYRDRCEEDDEPNTGDAMPFSTYFKSLHATRESGSMQIRLLDEIQAKLAAYSSSWPLYMPQLVADMSR